MREAVLRVAPKGAVSDAVPIAREEDRILARGAVESGWSRVGRLRWATACRGPDRTGRSAPAGTVFPGEGALGEIRPETAGGGRGQADERYTPTRVERG